MRKYIPSPKKYVADQVELYENSGGTEGITMSGLPVIIVTHIGNKTGSIRKTPLMTVLDDNNYVLVASQGGAPKNPLWYYNLKKNPEIQIQDKENIYSMRVKEINNCEERMRLWNLAIKAYPPYEDYQNKTERLIPLFLAEHKNNPLSQNE
ncbi:MAG: nitroreductase [Chloroflexi bacterium]|nr:nitroreductase [Chloroflexota bacterium]|tara:strand:+ start:424 stop:876 length:453 start_codon:yes stop_codon:yes gene_type:complete